MKREKQSIEELAMVIIALEKECQQGYNLKENLLKIEEITRTLTLEDMLAIDEIISKNLLTK